MIKLDIKKTNKSIRSENELLIESLKKHLNLIESEPGFPKLLRDIVAEIGLINQFDALKLFDQEACKMYKEVNKLGYHNIAVSYFFDRVHKEFPDFGCTFDDFLTLMYAGKQLFPLTDVVKELAIKVCNNIRETQGEKFF